MSTSIPTERVSAPMGVSKGKGKRKNPQSGGPGWMDWFNEHSTDFLKVGTILLVCLLSFVLGYKGSTNQLLYVIVALGGVLGLLVLLRWPGLGIIGIPMSGMFIHYIGPGGFNATMAIVALLLVLWVVDMVIFRQEIQLVASGTMAPVIAMMVAVTLSFAMGQLPWFSFVSSAPLDAQLGGYAVYFLSFGAFLLLANQFKDLRWLQGFTWIYVVLGGLYVVGLIVPALKVITRNTMGNMGSTFYVWLVGLAYSQALFNKKLNLGWRGLLLGVVVTSLYLLFTLKFKDKSGWLPVMVVLWVVTALWSWQLGAALLVVGIVGGLALIPQVLSQEEYSLATRLEVLPILAKIVRVNPVFGIGFANYYWYTPLFNLRGYYVSFNSHNNYADLIVQTGAVGTVIYVWLIAQVGYLAWRLRTGVPAGTFAHAYVNGAIAGGVGMIVVAFLGDWVLPFVYNIGLLGFRTSVACWLFLAGLVVLQQLYMPTQKGGEAAPLVHAEK